MSAESQQAQGADVLPTPPQQPLSSPIYEFGFPSRLELQPPVDSTIRSQSSSHPPRLDLVSSSTMNQARSANGGAVQPQTPADGENEVDELDEFDAQTPVELDFQLCDRLEAESLRTTGQRRQQSILSATSRSKGSEGSGSGSGHGSAVGNGSANARLPPKRSRHASVVGMNNIIDLRGSSPEPSAQPRKRSKSQLPADAGGPIAPFLQQAWVRDVMNKSRGVRAPSPAETPPVFTASQPQLRAASRAKHTRAVDGANPAAQTSQSNQSSSSSSDEEIPLAASLRASLATATQSASRHSTFAQVVSAVTEFKRACEEEIDGMRMKLIERDVVIVGLKAQLRKKSSQ